MTIRLLLARLVGVFNLPSEPSWPSYHDIQPLESGGVTARRGFEFQDHVAVGYCLGMCEDEALSEVWCESLDDITLVRTKEDGEEFEFVQAKNNEFNHLWSIAELCKRKKNKAGSSILEKSFAYERGAEPCCFRIVTSLRVNNDLQILTFPLSSPRRRPPSQELNALSKEISKKISDYTSPRGNDVSSWLSRTVWDVRHSSQALENDNLLKLRRIGYELNHFLAEDQWDEVYKKILSKIQDTSLLKWDINPEKKKVKREDFLDWLKQVFIQTQRPGIGGTGTKLQEKMELAGIPSESIETAKEQRRNYRMRTLDPSFMDLSKWKSVEEEAQAYLHELKSELDAGKLNDSGMEFHHLCLKRLSEFKHNHHENISLPLLHGYMYNLTDRCLHRFSRGGYEIYR